MQSENYTDGIFQTKQNTLNQLYDSNYNLNLNFSNLNNNNSNNFVIKTQSTNNFLGNTNFLKKNENNSYKINTLDIHNSNITSGSNKPKYINSIPSIYDDNLYSVNNLQILEKNVTEENLSKVKNLQTENFSTIEYKKPQIFNILRNFLLFFLLILVLISIGLIYYLYYAYDLILEFYDLKNTFLIRNSILFEIIYILKISIMNKENLQFNIYKNSTKYDLFEESIANMELNLEIIKKYNNENNLERFNLINVKFFEDVLQTKYFCEYFSFYKNKNNIKNIISNLSVIPNITIEYLESLKISDANFNENYNLCNSLTGNFFKTGFYEFLNIAKYNLKNVMSDFKNYISGKNDKEIYENKVIDLLNSGNLIVLEFCFNNILFDLNEIYIELLEESENAFFEKIFLFHTLTNYALISVIGIICILYFNVLFILIYKQNIVSDEAERIIKNSIYFKIL